MENPFLCHLKVFNIQCALLLKTFRFYIKNPFDNFFFVNPYIISRISIQ